MGLSLAITNNAPTNRSEEMWLRRQAIQIASQLPEDQAQALAVLAYARTLVTDFMAKDIKPAS